MEQYLLFGISEKEEKVYMFCFDYDLLVKQNVLHIYTIVKLKLNIYGY